MMLIYRSVILAMILGSAQVSFAQTNHRNPPIVDLGKIIGAEFRENFYITGERLSFSSRKSWSNKLVTPTKCPEDSFQFDWSSYCHYQTPPSVAAMAQKALDPRVLEFVTFSDLDIRDPLVVAVSQIEFNRINENIKSFYQDCMDGKLHKSFCNSASSSTMAALERKEIPAAIKHTIISAHRVDLTQTAKDYLRSQGLNQFDSYFYIIRYSDGELVMGKLEKNGGKPINSYQEVFLTPAGEFIWHNRFGRVDMM